MMPQDNGSCYTDVQVFNGMELNRFERFCSADHI